MSTHQEIEDAEAAVLGCCLLSDEALMTVTTSLGSADFSIPRHRVIFEAIRSLGTEGHNVDVVTTAGKLRAEKKLDAAGGESFLAQLTENLASAANVEFYLGAVREASQVRALSRAAEGVLAGVKSGLKAEDLQRIFDQAGRPEVRPQGRLEWRKVRDFVHKEKNGLKTGLEAMTGAGIFIPRSALTIVAARPGKGKSSMMMSLARNLATEVPVLFISYEEPIERLAYKIALGYLGEATPEKDALVNWRRFLRGEESAFNRSENFKLAQEIEASMVGILEERIGLFEGPGNIDALIRLIRAQVLRGEHHQKRPIAVFVDYIQLIPGSGTSYSRQTELAGVSGKLRELTKELGISVILGAQLTRSGSGQGKDKDDSINDSIRESDDILNDASLMITISSTGEAGGLVEKRQVEAKKNREGVAGVRVEVPFRGRAYSFINEAEVASWETAKTSPVPDAQRKAIV